MLNYIFNILLIQYLHKGCILLNSLVNTWNRKYGFKVYKQLNTR